jgi:uncharacterized protein
VASVSPNEPGGWHVDESPRVVQHELKFASGDAELSGTAYLPDEGDRLPAVVVLHAASEPVRQARLYEHLREGLPRVGFAVLLFDRRGAGGSTGNPDVDYDGLAADALAGQTALGQTPRVDIERIGFWGISQGGWIAMLAMNRSRYPAFGVAVSTPLCSVARQMDFACSNLLRVRGFESSEVEEMQHARGGWLDYLRGKRSLDSAAAQIRAIQNKPWFDLAFMPPVERLEESDGSLRELDFAPFDVIQKIQAARAPLLLMFGGRDPWVPVGESVSWLERAVGKPSTIEHVIIPRANHEMMFKERETMEFGTKTLPANAPEAPSYFMVLSSWMSRVCSKKRQEI